MAETPRVTRKVGLWGRGRGDGLGQGRFGGPIGSVSVSGI